MSSNGIGHRGMFPSQYHEIKFSSKCADKYEPIAQVWKDRKIFAHFNENASNRSIE